MIKEEILITGCASFIDSDTCVEFLNAGNIAMLSKHWQLKK
jgi:UDP-glucose 4-epimerase